MCASYLYKFDQLFYFEFFKLYQRVFYKFSFIALAGSQDYMQVLNSNLERLRLQLAPWNVYLQLLDIAFNDCARCTKCFLG